MITYDLSSTEAQRLTITQVETLIISDKKGYIRLTSNASTLLNLRRENLLGISSPNLNVNTLSTAEINTLATRLGSNPEFDAITDLNAQIIIINTKRTLALPEDKIFYRIFFSDPLFVFIDEITNDVIRHKDVVVKKNSGAMLITTAQVTSDLVSIYLAAKA